jgi:hypothetical protein
MTNSNPTQIRHTYRLLGVDGEVLEQSDWPTDGEAIAWAEVVRRRTRGLTVRRIELLDESEDWVFVSEAGTSAAHQWGAQSGPGEA